MTEAKVSHDIMPDEKISESPPKYDEHAEDTGRRKSVALNIVENPLKVSYIKMLPAV